MTANQYEDQYGRLPDSSTDQGELRASPPVRGAAIAPAPAPPGPIIVDQGSAEDYGFGSHFMDMDDGQDDQYIEPPAVQVNHSLGDTMSGRAPLANPPKADVQNPKNKFCSPCNRDFNRRQAFVEHCRNVHRMNIKLASHKPPAVQPQQQLGLAAVAAPVAAPMATITPPGANPMGYKCDYCPKSFSNRSNKNRHMLLSCEVAGPNARNTSGGGPNSQGASPVTPKSNNNTSNGGFRESLKRLNSGDFIYDPQISGRRAAEPQELKCSQEGCEEVFFRSALMERHLLEVHNVKVDAADNTPHKQGIKQEISSPTSAEAPSDEEKKVPALRIKLPSSGGSGREEDETGGIEVPVEFDEDEDEANGMDDDDDDEPPIPVEATLEIDEGEEDDEIPVDDVHEED